MKKIVSLFTLSALLLISVPAFSLDEFSALENLTDSQKQQISYIQNNFKSKNNDIETRISAYTDKIAKLRNNTEKTHEQISLLTASYERNIETLKSQQDILIQETNNLYKSVLNPSQYKQYQAMQLNVNNAFSNFIKK